MRQTIKSGALCLIHAIRISGNCVVHVAKAGGSVIKTSVDLVEKGLSKIENLTTTKEAETNGGRQEETTM